MDYALNALQQAWLQEGDHGDGLHVVVVSSAGGGSPLVEVVGPSTGSVGAKSPTLCECVAVADKQRRVALPCHRVIGPSSLTSASGSYVDMDKVLLHILIKGMRSRNMDETF